MLMNYKEEDSVSYSTSCIPPDIHNGSGDCNHIDNGVQQTIIRFPTLFGKSMGFTRFDVNNRQNRIVQFKSKKQTKTEKKNQNKIMSRSASTIPMPVKRFNLNTNYCMNGQNFRTTQFCKKMGKFSMDLNHRVYYYNLPPALPKEYNPRSHERSKSFNKHILSISNRNNSNCDPEYLSNTNTNINNINPTPERMADDWIDLYFQFPDGHKMKFKTRKKAMLKYSLEAFSARMGYASIYDLTFKTPAGQVVYHNESAATLGLKDGDSIIVENKKDE